MSASKVAVSIQPELLAELDNFVAKRVFSSRSQAVQVAVQEKIARLKRHRLAEKCAKLDPAEEQALAEVGLARDYEEWPEY